MAYTKEDFIEIEKALKDAGDDINPKGYTKVYALNDVAEVAKNENRNCFDALHRTTHITIKPPSGAYAEHNQIIGGHPTGIDIVFSEGSKESNNWPITIGQKQDGSSLYLDVIGDFRLHSGKIATLIVGN